MLLLDKTYSHFSLHKRILSLFVLLACISFLSITVVSNYTISKIIDNKLVGEYENNLSQIRISLENIISNLNLVSQQLGLNNETIQMLEKYFSTEDPYERAVLNSSIQNAIRFITFTNPNIGLCYYYNQDINQVLFNNLPLPKDKNPFQSNSILLRTNSFTYYGPHESQSSFCKNQVLSISCKVDTIEASNIYLYVETNYRTIKNIFQNINSDDVSLLILDKLYRITYSELNEIFPIGSVFYKTDNSYFTVGDYYCFLETTKQGFHIASLVNQSSYNKERNQWFQSILFLAILLIILSVGLATILYRTVYQPLNHFDKQLDMLLSDDDAKIVPCTNIPEYDYILSRFGDIRSQLDTMIGEIVQHEKYRNQLELEKLRYQINPHFLMNTLNTVHWMAIMNDQEEIDTLIQSLNHLLAYNLDKCVDNATIETEITALTEYIEIQQSRYDFSFEIIREPEEIQFLYPCPKFILQPLVENSLYHGYKENMKLILTITLGERILISIKDTGLGMTDEQLSRFRNHEFHSFIHNKEKSRSMGIGLEYVLQSLLSYYKNDFNFSIDSEIENGTTIILSLPIYPTSI
ncbi:MAG: histidine kinase [Anaerocolumna sp.]|nr:histidine kinase [Anaerocolumna sp.]